MKGKPGWFLEQAPVLPTPTNANRNAWKNGRNRRKRDAREGWRLEDRRGTNVKEKEEG